MDYETEINDILNNISNDECVPLNLIQNNREKAVSIIYDKFMNLPKNKDNLVESQEILQNYEYIDDINNLKPNDKFRYISTRFFYDLKVSPVVSFIKCDYGKIHFRNGLYLKSVKNNVHIFKLMSEETMAKMKLIELIQE